MRFLEKNMTHFLKFGGIGILNTACQQGLYLILVLYLCPYLIAQGLSFLLALCLSFYLNSFYNYKVKPSWCAFLSFALANVPAWFVQFATLYGLVHWFGTSKVAALLCTLAITVPLSFFFVSKTMLQQPPLKKEDSPYDLS